MGWGVAGTMGLATVRRIGAQVTKDTPDADGIWIASALMPSVSTIESLEQETRLPVIASVQVHGVAGVAPGGGDGSDRRVWQAVARTLSASPRW